MNTDEKNRYISEQMGWFEKVSDKDRNYYGSIVAGPFWLVKFDYRRNEPCKPSPAHNCVWHHAALLELFVYDHLSNAFAYVVPWLREVHNHEHLTGVEFIYDNQDNTVMVILYLWRDGRGKFIIAGNFVKTESQAICEAFIMYMRGKDDT